MKTLASSQHPQRPVSFSQAAIVGGILLLGLIVRLYHITYPPMDYHPMRQHHSAIIARWFYWQHLHDIPAEQKAAAKAAFQEVGIKEPPIMEGLTAGIWRLAGAIHLWIPRVLATAFWLIAGFFLYRIAWHLLGRPVAMVSLALFLFLPFGYCLSRSFMPEPLMMMFFMAGVWFILRYQDQPARGTLIAAGFCCGLAILVKFVVVFPLAGAFLVLSLSRQGFKGVLRDPKNWGFALLAVGPGFAYYLAMMLGNTCMPHVAGTIFKPRLLTTSFFWLGWFKVISRVTGTVPFLLGVVGFLALREPISRRLLTGLWAGYVIYGLLFTYTTATHDYYQVAFFPIVIIPLAWLIVAWVRYLKSHRILAGMAILALVVGGMAGGFYAQKVLSQPENKPLRYQAEKVAGVLCGNQPIPKVMYPNLRIAAIAENVGRAVHHSDNTIFLAEEYGYPLMYYGGLAGDYWPDTDELNARAIKGEPVPERTAVFMDQFFPQSGHDYFVVTDMNDFNLQKELNHYLRETFTLWKETPDYLIFDLRTKRSAP